jgi:hypothetical protein
MKRDVEIFDNGDLARLIKSERFSDRVNRIQRAQLSVEAHFLVDKMFGFDSYSFEPIKTGSPNSVIPTFEHPQRILDLDDDHHVLPLMKKRKKAQKYGLVNLHTHPSGHPFPSPDDLEVKTYTWSGLPGDSLNLILTFSEDVPYLTAFEKLSREEHARLTWKDYVGALFDEVKALGITPENGVDIINMGISNKQWKTIVRNSLETMGTRGIYFPLSAPEEEVKEALAGFKVYGDRTNLNYSWIPNRER